MMKSDGTFEQDIACIIAEQNGKGAIYVSNIQVAQNPLTLKKHNIGAVITAIKGKNLSDKIPKHIEYLYIPVVDHESNDISVFFKDSYQFIDQERKRTNVLVHCMAGVSRSVTLVIAYIMEKSNIPYQTAFDYVKCKRTIMHPNESFIKQLKVLDEKLIKNRQPQTIEPVFKPKISQKRELIMYKEKATLINKSINTMNKQLSDTIDSSNSGFYTPKKKCKIYPEIHLQSELKKIENRNDQNSQYDKILRMNIKKFFSSTNTPTKLGSSRTNGQIV